ncbi:MAG: hypothetical protein ACRC2T_10365 [Thermoguttaceae bacterium]
MVARMIFQLLGNGCEAAGTASSAISSWPCSPVALSRRLILLVFRHFSTDYAQCP